MCPAYFRFDRIRDHNIKVLLANKADVNVVRKTDGLTPLFMASQEGYVEGVELLLANNADVNAATIDDGTTPLYMAKQEHHAEVEKLLLAAGGKSRRNSMRRRYPPRLPEVYFQDVDGRHKPQSSRP